MLKRSNINKITFRVLSLSSCAKNHYEILGIPCNATQADIKAAYYKLSMIYHPDKNKTEDAVKKFQNITVAYEIVGNVKLRKLYDKGLLGLSNRATGPNTYTSYNPDSSIYKNRPVHHSKTKVYSFDEWTRSHYGETLNRKVSAKFRYEQKVIKKEESNSQNKSEIAVITMAVLIMFIIFSFKLNNSLDDAAINPENKNQKET